MNKLFGLFLLAVACWAPDLAQAANCFWVGGSGTWDNTNTGGGGAGGIKWASASGGGTACAATSGPAAGVPGPSDTATIDANASGLNGGTITVSGATISVTSITTSAANGTVNFGTNNVTTQSFNNSGSGTRTINMGSGTWTISGTSGNILDNATQTNCTSCVYSNAPIVFSANSNSARLFQSGTVTYNSLTVNNNSSPGNVGIQNGSTFASITVGTGTTLTLPGAVTTTVTGAVAINGSSTAPSGLSVLNPTTGVATLSVGSASTITWSGVQGITRSGAGTLDATCSFDMGRNSSFTSISFSTGSCPGGSGGGGRIIGG